LPIQVPERELSKLRQGQRAYLTVEPWPGERFEARVLRISPVVDSATGTIKVTLETRPQGKLRPGMFSRVFVETDTRGSALVIPKAALSLESIGDTVYVVDGDVASRREIDLGFAEGDFVEARSGVAHRSRFWSRTRPHRRRRLGRRSRVTGPRRGDVPTVSPVTCAARERGASIRRR
jgi:RND family efflux transporter MFP subunit